MAYTISKITVVGTLAADAEVRTLDSGSKVASGRVAVNVKLGKKEFTNWFSFSIWEKLAETVGPLLHKGDKVFLEGHLELREYEGKNGSRGIDATIHPDTIICLGSGRVERDGDLGPADDDRRRAPRDESPFNRKA